MNFPQSNPSNQKPLRLWPGVTVVILQWLSWIGVPIVAPDLTPFAIIGGTLCGLVVLVWWAFFSRVPQVERWGGLAFGSAAVAATPQIPGMLHPTMADGLFWAFVIPGLCLALVVWAGLSRFLDTGTRRVALVAAIVLSCGIWSLVRAEGITGKGRTQFAWRWKQTAEQQLLAQAASEAVASPAAVPTPEPKPSVETPAASPALPKTATPARATSHIDWPGFRGTNRNGVVTGLRIATDWAASPPAEIWRRPVGPGWSSFAVGDGLLYTQEQRGGDEVVSCYHAATGKPVWTHRDAARFFETAGGAGPRGTPTLHDGRIYALGATGILNALDAATGAVVWTRNAASDTGANTPQWGFSSSPLVVDDLVIVAASGRLAAYDLATGAPRWVNKEGGGSYSSPQLLTIGGVAQIVLLANAGASGIAPTDGKVLWTIPWPEAGMPIVQPALTADGGVLGSTGTMLAGMGVRRLAVAQGPSGWTVAEVWTSRGLKPFFNDFVVHNGHAFGFDGSILSSIDLKDGARKWKGGRYGNGQLVVLADQDLLLVLSEEGELALVKATADQFTELARVPAIEGKTWNHPVVAGGVLLVRNSQEMAAFRLALARN